jgi:2'-5' RNA ligase
LRDENRFVLYFRTATNIPLKKYRDELHTSYNRIDIINNSFEFSPHMTFLRIQDSEVFEIYRNNLEKIILQDLSKLKKINISKGEVSLYAVNSEYKEEIQIAI